MCARTQTPSVMLVLYLSGCVYVEPFPLNIQYPKNPFCVHPLHTQAVLGQVMSFLYKYLRCASVCRISKDPSALSSYTIRWTWSISFVNFPPFLFIDFFFGLFRFGRFHLTFTKSRPCARVCDMGSDVSFWTQLTPYTLNLFVSFFPFANGKWRCAGSRQQQANTRGNTRSLLTWQRYKPAAFGRKKQKGKKNSPSCCRRVSCVIHFRLGR